MSGFEGYVGDGEDGDHTFYQAIFGVAVDTSKQSSPPKRRIDTTVRGINEKIEKTFISRVKRAKLTRTRNKLSFVLGSPSV